MWDSWVKILSLPLMSDTTLVPSLREPSFLIYITGIML